LWQSESRNKMTKVRHDYKCQNCGEPATYNLQGGGWCLWSISRTGGFIREKEWGMGDDDNEFYCDKCAEKEEII
jgi:hypothetical protein